MSTLTRPGAYAHSTRTPTAVRLLPKVPVQVANFPFDNAALHQYVSAELSKACSASKAEAAASPSTDNVLDEEADRAQQKDGSQCPRLRAASEASKQEAQQEGRCVTTHGSKMNEEAKPPKVPFFFGSATQAGY